MLEIYNCTIWTESEHPRSGKVRAKEPICCPMCKVSAKPTLLFALIRESYNGMIALLDIMFLCHKCKRSFIAHYPNIVFLLNNESANYVAHEYEYLSPSYHNDRSFNEVLMSLSPKFCEIYNQAAAAEHNNLYEIAGMGYRKSLEFLVKDYAIYFNPDKIENIKSITLAKCIDTYIGHAKIKVLAVKSAWLGNDETHYTRKHEDYDISDLKEFIDALILYVSMELSLEKAKGINPK